MSLLSLTFSFIYDFGFMIILNEQPQKHNGMGIEEKTFYFFLTEKKYL